jgi:hypothetical protein
MDHHLLLPTTTTIIVSTRANIIHLITHITAAMGINNRTTHLTAAILTRSTAWTMTQDVDQVT